ncbi:MAG: hypothetical protein A3K65_04495 [Euryarchaeota archaeon RBG_16_68_12]|nr:MAG: hypothetical protein A3K65_04495 [Euryarchaeota archaeon RBG_16_68_12]
MTPAAAVHSLQDLIESMGLPTGVESSLEAPLKEAVHILNDDNPSNDVAVCGKLGAFLHQVDAKEKSGKLGASEAEELRLVATRIQVKLGC